MLRLLIPELIQRLWRFQMYQRSHSAIALHIGCWSARFPQEESLVWCCWAYGVIVRVPCWMCCRLPDQGKNYLYWKCHHSFLRLHDLESLPWRWQINPGSFDLSFEWRRLRKSFQLMQLRTHCHCSYQIRQPWIDRLEACIGRCADCSLNLYFLLLHSTLHFLWIALGFLYLAQLNSENWFHLHDFVPGDSRLFRCWWFVCHRCLRRCFSLSPEGCH